MTSANQGHINRQTKEISNLRKAESQETQKEADIQAKINRANEAAARTKNISTHQNKLKEVERAFKNLAAVQKKRAEIASKIANKSKSLHCYEKRQSREDEKKIKKVATEQKRLIREREEYERRITNENRRHSDPSLIPDRNVHAQVNYDFFISHASEDKEDFVRGLVEALQARGAKVWYDEFTLKVGDSLRREIERGLGDSRFGVVVLSKHFFRKEWPQKELDGLASLEVLGETRILPIWHEISKDEVTRRSPILSDKIALNTFLSSTGEIADELYKLVD